MLLIMGACFYDSSINADHFVKSELYNRRNTSETAHNVKVSRLKRHYEQIL